MCIRPASSSFPTARCWQHGSKGPVKKTPTTSASWVRGNELDMAEWGEPFVLADTPGHPDCNPVLWIDDDDRLWLFWSAILSNEWGSSLVKYRISTNYLAMDGPPAMGLAG